MKYNVVFEQKRKGKDTICKIYYMDGMYEFLLARGRASCAPSDNPDLEIGKKLALSRAYNKLADWEGDFQQDFIEWVSKNA
jgi:hypothetical protein